MALELRPRHRRAVGRRRRPGPVGGGRQDQARRQLRLARAARARTATTPPPARSRGALPTRGRLRPSGDRADRRRLRRSPAATSIAAPASRALDRQLPLRRLRLGPPLARSPTTPPARRSNELLLETGKNISSFGEGADGELYVLSYGDGIIYKLVPAATPPGTQLPRSCSRRPAASIRPIRRAQPSANADPLRRQRAAVVRRRRQAALAGAAGGRPNPRQRRRRLGSADRHRADEGVLRSAASASRRACSCVTTTATGPATATSGTTTRPTPTLLPASKTKDLGNGQSWYFPSRNECLQCHTHAAGRTLGLETAQLNRDAPDGGGNQLATLDGTRHVRRAAAGAAGPAAGVPARRRRQRAGRRSRARLPARQLQLLPPHERHRGACRPIGAPR